MKDRSRVRRVLYVAGLLPSLLLLLVSARIVLMLAEDARGSAAWDREDWAAAETSYSRDGLLNPFERWVAPLGEGAALYRLEKYDEAVGAFEVAVAHAPADRECPLRVNLALAHEAVGDGHLADGDMVEAEAAWGAGRAALSSCDSAPADRVADRLVEKLGPVPQEVPRPEPPEADAEELAKLERLEKLNDEAVRRRGEAQRDDLLPPPGSVPAW